MQQTVLGTTLASLVAQLVTGFIGAVGLAYDVPPEHQALKTSLKIELVVQMIEFLFYIWFLAHFNLLTMAPTRYKDWVVSTPLMLVSAMLYFYYEQARQEGRDTTDAVGDFFQSHRDTIAIVILANFVMVAFGYAGEMGWISMGLGLVLGFVAFGVAFYTMWSRLASKSVNGKRLFSVIASVWSLYGVVYVLPAAAKNIAYNGLDVVAKNFFGVFLSYKVIQASLSTRPLAHLSHRLLECERTPPLLAMSSDHYVELSPRNGSWTNVSGTGPTPTPVLAAPGGLGTAPW